MGHRPGPHSQHMQRNGAPGPGPGPNFPNNMPNQMNQQVCRLESHYETFG